MTSLPEPLTPAQRKPIGKKLRFEVFKRDGFVCQYCGAHPPAVILQVDHIVPVADGGDNDVDNLITSCQPCNLGKGATPLSNVPRPLAEKAAEILEREEQIKGYQAVLAARRLRLEEEVSAIDDRYTDFNPGYGLSEPSLVSVRMFVEKLGFHSVYDAMELAGERWGRQPGKIFKYFCGICWNRIRERN